MARLRAARRAIPASSTRHVPVNGRPAATQAQTQTKTRHPAALSKEERDRLILDNQDLVQSQATHLKNQLPAHLERDDLVSHGQIGLLKAADSYNHTSHIPFRVWAHFKIRGSIIDAFRRRRYRDEMHVGLDDHNGRVRETEGATAFPEPLSSTDPLANLIAAERHKRIQLALRSLPAGERRAVRTILNDEYLSTQGRREGVSEVTICTRRLKALQKLREYMRRQGLSAADLLT